LSCRGEKKRRLSEGGGGAPCFPAGGTGDLPVSSGRKKGRRKKNLGRGRCRRKRTKGGGKIKKLSQTPDEVGERKKEGISPIFWGRVGLRKSLSPTWRGTSPYDTQGKRGDQPRSGRKEEQTREKKSGHVLFNSCQGQGKKKKRIALNLGKKNVRG